MAILGLFLLVWAVILGASIGAAMNGETADIANEYVVAAGALGTLLASLTSAAIGSTIAVVKTEQSGKQRESFAAAVEWTKDDDEASAAPIFEPQGFRISDVSERLGGRVKAAIAVYLLVGISVLVVWLFIDDLSPGVVSSFALSLVGWLVGAASIVFEDAPPTGGPAPTSTPAPEPTP
ncbi:hypothetical protein ACDF64_12095 [Agromyces sp. MMS24-JH15]|uniref:hypothetical protein n=1 Tax=Agromyces sp. MMS24-JH15 TaxID=3243765 RepID=UPI003747AECE